MFNEHQIIFVQINSSQECGDRVFKKYKRSKREVFAMSQGGKLKWYDIIIIVTNCDYFFIKLCDSLHWSTVLP